MQDEVLSSSIINYVPHKYGGSRLQAHVMQYWSWSILLGMHVMWKQLNHSTSLTFL